MWGLHVVVLVVRGILIEDGRCPLLGLVHWKLDDGAVCIENSQEEHFVWTR